MQSSSQGQGIFEDLLGSRPRASKCVLEDSTSAIVVVRDKIKPFLSNITFADSTIDCYKSTFSSTSFDNH